MATLTPFTPFTRAQPWERAAYCRVAERQPDGQFTLILTALREQDDFDRILGGAPRNDGVEVARFAPPADRNAFWTETGARNYAYHASRGSPDHPLVRLP